MGPLIEGAAQQRARSRGSAKPFPLGPAARRLRLQAAAWTKSRPLIAGLPPLSV
jgi:hypothetical protein